MTTLRDVESDRIAVFSRAAPAWRCDAEQVRAAPDGVHGTCLLHASAFCDSRLFGH